MRRIIVLSSAILAALVLALAGIAAASPSVGQNGATGVDTPSVYDIPNAYEEAVEVKEDGWIVFKEQQEEYALDNATVYTKQGKRTADGDCVYAGELVLPAGSKAEAVVEREIANNPSTCQMRLERGTPPADAIDEDRSEEDIRSGQQPDSPRGTSNSRGGFSTAAVSHSAGFFEGRFEDPVNAVVNLVRNRTNWYYNGRDVLRSSSGYYYWPLSETGWELRENNWRHYYTDYQTTSSSYVHFRNRPFCDLITPGPFPMSTTHVYHDRNTVHGRFNGDLVGQWGWRKSGGCHGLLTYEKRLVRTR